MKISTPLPFTLWPGERSLLQYAVGLIATSLPQPNLYLFPVCGRFSAHAVSIADVFVNHPSGYESRTGC